MQEVLVRRGEVRVPLPAREAARMRHKRNRARELGGQGIPRGHARDSSRVMDINDV
jgi:hypothetical protein